MSKFKAAPAVILHALMHPEARRAELVIARIVIAALAAKFGIDHLTSVASAASWGT